MMRTQIFVSLGACVLLTCGCGSGSSQNDVRQGMAAFNAKNYTEAIAHLSRATQRITDSADLYYQLGAAHLEKGELDPAAEAFQAALELVPAHGGALAGLGQVAFHKKEFPKAQAFFEQALGGTATGDVARASMLNGLALTLAAQERYDLARLHLLRAQQASRTYAPSLYNLGSLYLDKFNLREEALDLFEMYLSIAGKQDDHYAKAENQINRLRLNLERTQADELDSLKRDPAAAATLLHEGINAQSAKQYAKAAKAYRDALAADPIAFNAALGLAMTHQKQGQRAEAMEAFKRAASINPSHQDSHLQAAELAFQLKRYEEAEKILDRAIARRPYNPASAELMARIRYAQARLPEARLYGEFYLSVSQANDKTRGAYEKWVQSLPVK